MVMSDRDYGNVRIIGAETAAKILKEFDFKIRRRIVVAAVRAGANVIKNEAKARCPEATGATKRQITVRSVKTHVSGKVTATVKPKLTKARKAKGERHRGRVVHLITGDTKPHEIKPRKAKALLIGGDTGSLKGAVKHPGTRGRPFMDEAIRSGMGVAIIEFTRKMDQGILKEAAKFRAAQEARK